MRMLDLFSGIGGFSLAAHWTGEIETVAFCEIDPYATRVLNKNFPGVPVEPDIRRLKNNGQYGQVDIICGGFPCQPFSIAGKQKGTADDRDLWPEMLRVIQEFKPTWVVGENVANFVDMELERTCTDLEAEGYETQSFIIPACGVDAKHERKRVWIVADSKSKQGGRLFGSGIQSNTRTESESVLENTGRELWQGCEFTGENGKETERGATNQPVNRPVPPLAHPKSERIQGVRTDRQQKSKTLDRKGLPDSARSELSSAIWPVEPAVGRVANGIPNRVDRLKCLGNSIVPQVVYPIFKAITDTEFFGGLA